MCESTESMRGRIRTLSSEDRIALAAFADKRRVLATDEEAKKFWRSIADACV